MLKTTGKVRLLFTALAVSVLALLLGGCASAGREETATDPLSKRVASWQHRPGLLDLYIDSKNGKVWLVVPEGDERGLVGEYLYVEGLVTGLGSNPVGLDRGQLGPTRLLAFRRVGNRLLLEQPNLRFRATSDDRFEARATRESFAPSVLWAGEAAEVGGDGRWLVDFTSFLVRDAHGVVARLKTSGQGQFALDTERSAVELDRVQAFPDNLEFESLLTYASQEPGRLVRGIAPEPGSLTLVQHHSLIRLPDTDYQPRPFHPASGSFFVQFKDYAAPLEQGLDRRWIVRHHLQTGLDGVEPLVYYVDRGVPEPVRSALIDGASWWEEAFAAAGFPGAFQVELLPEEADPLDVRYNVIQWVHRATRGWSYGGGVIDPRTGQMIKGHVNLGSLRIRQDRLLFESLLGTKNTGDGSPEDPVQLALARIRQLAAHEVGHTLGLAHNFAASTYGRASVMDYPAPLVLLGEDGSLDISRAYGVGVGQWDVQAVRYAYTQYEGEESGAQGLAAILRENLDRGLLFLSDTDARPPGAAHPAANLWDNGIDPVAQLHLELDVRDVAVARFGANRALAGEPLALLEERFAILYFRHRYQLTAAAKAIGGRLYDYAISGDGDAEVRAVPAEMQRRALRAVLRALTPEVLDIPERVLKALHPRPFGYGTNREMFPSRTAPDFDALGAAATAAQLAIDAVLDPQRATRLVDQSRRDSQLPGLEEVLNELVRSVFASNREGEREREIQRTVRNVTVAGLLRLADDARAPERVRARVAGRLEFLAAVLSAETEEITDTDAIHRRFLVRKIRRFLDRWEVAGEAVPSVDPPPPGQPIGGALWAESECTWVPPAPEGGSFE